MKQLTLIAILLTQTAIALSQTQTKEKAKEQSNVEIFSNRAGTLIQKEFENIGSVKKCEIQIAKFTDIITGQKSNGVRFEYEYKSSYSSDTKLAFLDVDEIDGLIKSIKLIQSKVFVTTPTNYTEVSFKSRSGFEAGCFTSKGTWSTYMKIEKNDNNSFVFMDKENLESLLILLERTKGKL